MTQAALRGERQASLGQLETATLEYSITGNKPAEALPTLEIYDSAKHTETTLPDWLKSKSFSGIVSREKQSVLVASRQITDEKGRITRTIVFAQPIDHAWIEALHDKDGMITAAPAGATATRRTATTPKSMATSTSMTRASMRRTFFLSSFVRYGLRSRTSSGPTSPR
jgi:hypothetical protein